MIVGAITFEDGTIYIAELICATYQLPNHENLFAMAKERLRQDVVHSKNAPKNSRGVIFDKFTVWASTFTDLSLTSSWWCYFYNDPPEIVKNTVWKFVQVKFTRLM